MPMEKTSPPCRTRAPQEMPQVRDENARAEQQEHGENIENAISVSLGKGANIQNSMPMSTDQKKQPAASLDIGHWILVVGH
jgi:hypothetical protein